MHVVILSGGVGARLWPVSRDTHPKPFMRLADGLSLLQKVYLRSASVDDINSITTVTHKDLLFKTTKEYMDVDIKSDISFDCNYILEPFGKNTAAAIALATQKIAHIYGDDALILVLPADHLITAQDAFHHAIAQAKHYAQIGKLVTFGIKPNTPQTGYGYIESKGHTLVRFIEKPPLAQAEIYIKNPDFLWNSGMFCFRADTMLEQMQLHSPEIAMRTHQCLQQSKLIKSIGLYNLDVDPDSFALVPEDSIDYAVMEKTQTAVVIPCDIGWSDVGTWSAIHAEKTSDDQGNYLEGEVITHDVNNCYISSPDRVIGAVGLNNLIIVDTPDALLVAHQDHSQEVKQIYTQLKHKQHETHKLHTLVQRPWGTYTVLESALGYKVKRLEVDPGASLSLQLHHHRAEHWVVVSGIAHIRNGDKELILSKNESTSIPTGTLHRLSNQGSDKLILLEIQTGSYLAEDDIMRFDDIYGRTVHTAELAR